MFPTAPKIKEKHVSINSSQMASTFGNAGYKLYFCLVNTCTPESDNCGIFRDNGHSTKRLISTGLLALQNSYFKKFLENSRKSRIPQKKTEIPEKI